MTTDADFDTLLAWFCDGFEQEIPTKISARGVWHGDYDIRAYGPLSTPRDLAGGSVLGAPDQPVAFRRYIEDHPRKLGRGGAYARPFRAALADLTGRHRCIPADRQVPGHDCGSSPLMARYLYALGMAQGDWREVCRRWNIKPIYARAYTWTALRRLESRYSSYPLRTSWVDRSESDRNAIIAGEQP